MATRSAPLPEQIPRPTNFADLPRVPLWQIGIVLTTAHLEDTTEDTGPYLVLQGYISRPTMSTMVGHYQVKTIFPKFPRFIMASCPSLTLSNGKTE